MSKIAVHLTERVMFEWPAEYWVELLHMLTKSGHEVYAFSDETNVQINDDNPLLFDRCRMPDDIAEREVAKCDLFIGTPLKYYEMARRNSVKTLCILGATKKGEGIVSPIQCAGCKDTMPELNDCYWNDENCYWEITPIDVMEEACRLLALPKNAERVPSSA